MNNKLMYLSIDHAEEGETTIKDLCTVRPIFSTIGGTTHKPQF